MKQLNQSFFLGAAAFLCSALCTSDITGQACVGDYIPDGDEMPCGEPGIPCCSEPFACNGPNSPCNNYDPDFQDTGGCDLSCTAGCMDEEAENYDAGADYEDGTCVYSTSDTTICELLTYDGNGDGMVNYQDFLGFLSAYGVADLDGDCIEDSVDDNVCIGCGCTDPDADNYDPSASVDDGSCYYPGFEACDGLTSLNFDGYEYELIVFGDECWFAENLRSEHYSNGHEILHDLSNTQWATTELGAQAIWDDDPIWLAEKGRLYNWYAVMDSRGLCPNGWHVPSDEEWMALEIVLGIPFTEVYNIGYRGTDQGVQMKSSPEDSPPWNGSNSSGFSGLNGRYRAGPPLGGFAIDGNGWYWTSTGSGTTTAWHRRLYQGSDQISRMNNLNTNCGFSVRCLKNSE